MSEAIESAESAKTEQMSLPRIAMGLLRHYLGGRRRLIVLAAVILGAGAYFNWGWLVAVGIAPLLLTLAPCAAMCALGLCMNKMGGKSCAAESKPGEQNGAATNSGAIPSTRSGDGQG